MPEFKGSILGPLFFLIYINDLSDGLTSNPKLFADETSLLAQWKLPPRKLPPENQPQENCPLNMGSGLPLNVQQLLIT